MTFLSKSKRTSFKKPVWTPEQPSAVQDPDRFIPIKFYSISKVEMRKMLSYICERVIYREEKFIRNKILKIGKSDPTIHHVLSLLDSYGIDFEFTIYLDPEYVPKKGVRKAQEKRRLALGLAPIESIEVKDIDLFEG
jgi:hypothetical protein